MTTISKYKENMNSSASTGYIKFSNFDYRNNRKYSLIRDEIARKTYSHNIIECISLHDERYEYSDDRCNTYDLRLSTDLQVLFGDISRQRANWLSEEEASKESFRPPTQHRVMKVIADEYDTIVDKYPTIHSKKYLSSEGSRNKAKNPDFKKDALLCLLKKRQVVCIDDSIKGNNRKLKARCHKKKVATDKSMVY